MTATNEQVFVNGKTCCKVLCSVRVLRKEAEDG